MVGQTNKRLLFLRNINIELINLCQSPIMGFMMLVIKG